MSPFTVVISKRKGRRAGIKMPDFGVLIFLVMLCLSPCLSLPVGRFENPRRHSRQIRHLHQQHRRHADASLERNVFSSDENFPDGYWLRIAQAKALALAVENGTLPRLDELSEIMKPAGCNKYHDKECQDFVNSCADEKAAHFLKQLSLSGLKPTAANISNYITTLFNLCHYHGYFPEESFNFLMAPPEYSPPEPHFHCNSYLGHNQVHSHFRLEYPQKSLPSPLPKDLIPRYFILEKSVMGGPWTFASDKPVQAFWLFSFNTQANQTFRIRVTAISPHYVYPPVVSKVIHIYRSSELEVKSPNNLRVVNISVDDTAARPHPSALIRWNSGSGSNASCDFNVYYMYDDMDIKERGKADDAFWVKLDKLKFNAKYTLRVLEKFGEGKESSGESQFYIPSCLQMRKFSFELCPPPPPTEVRIENATEHSFWVAWRAPKYVNATNRILYYNVTVDWIYTPTPALPPTTAYTIQGHHGPDLTYPSLNPISAPSTYITGHHGARPSPVTTHRIYVHNVPGNQTSCFVGNVTQLRGQFKISVTAVSSAGASPAVWDVVYYKGTQIDVAGLHLNDWTLWKILTLVLTLLGVAALISFFCVLKHYHERRQRKRKRQEQFEKYEEESLQMQQFGQREATKWEIECCNLDLKEGIGKGNFGLVRRAILNQRGKKMTVAVKTLRDGVNEKDVEKIWEEYEILKNLDPHVHVVGLKGIVTKHVPFPLLVVEYCDGGDLQSYLRKVVEGQRKHQNPSVYSGSSTASSIVNLTVNQPGAAAAAAAAGGNSNARIVTNAAYFMGQNPDANGEAKAAALQPLTIADLLSFARQIAVGMEYLSNNKIVHRDLAARNILISGKSRILKISDFGLSRDVYEQSMYKQTSKGEIPIKWLAIESILNELYTTKSDVWSYGILLWEIFTYGGIPYPGVENRKVFDLLKEGYRMSRPPVCPEELYELITHCWNDDPQERPDFTQIRLMLEDIIEKTTHVTYLNLDNSSSSSAGGKSEGQHSYKNTDSGFEEYEVNSQGTGCEPMLPPRNKKPIFAS